MYQSLLNDWYYFGLFIFSTVLALPVASYNVGFGGLQDLVLTHYRINKGSMLTVRSVVFWGREGGGSTWN